MVMERLDATRAHRENQGPVQQFAITQATRLLVDAGVTDPGPLTAEATPVLPERAVRLPDITTLGMGNTELERLAVSTTGLSVETGAIIDVIQRRLTSLEEPQTLSLVALDTCTMGLRDHSPTNEIWEYAKKFGDRVSAEAMVRLAVEAAKGNVQVEIGKPLVGIMEPIAGLFGFQLVLDVGRDEGGLWLRTRVADPGRLWNPGNQFVVSLRK